MQFVYLGNNKPVFGKQFDTIKQEYHLKPNAL